MPEIFDPYDILGFAESQPHMTPYKPNPVADALGGLAKIFGAVMLGKDLKKNRQKEKEIEAYESWKRENDKADAAIRNEYNNLLILGEKGKQSDDERKRGLEPYITARTVYGMTPEEAFPYLSDEERKKFKAAPDITREVQEPTDLLAQMLGGTEKRLPETYTAEDIADSVALSGSPVVNAPGYQPEPRPAPAYNREAGNPFYDTFFKTESAPVKSGRERIEYEGERYDVPIDTAGELAQLELEKERQGVEAGGLQIRGMELDIAQKEFTNNLMKMNLKREDAVYLSKVIQPLIVGQAMGLPGYDDAYIDSVIGGLSFYDTDGTSLSISPSTARMLAKGEVYAAMLGGSGGGGGGGGRGGGGRGGGGRKPAGKIDIVRYRGLMDEVDEAEVHIVSLQAEKTALAGDKDATRSKMNKLRIAEIDAELATTQAARAKWKQILAKYQNQFASDEELQAEAAETQGVSSEDIFSGLEYSG